MSEWTAQCAEALSADGLLARQLQGFAFREGQQLLSEEIARAIEDRAVLIAEGLAEPWRGRRSDWCALDGPLSGAR